MFWSLGYFGVSGSLKSGLIGGIRGSELERPGQPSVGTRKAERNLRGRRSEPGEDFAGWKVEEQRTMN